MKPSAARTRYQSAAKATARDMVVAAVKDLAPETILDLWGGGASARAFREAVPSASIISCENDQQLWPAMMLDAQQSGYGYHFGDVRQAKGRFDFIWLDLCSQWCGAARDQLAWAKSRLTENGTIALTLLAAREAPEIAADRLFMVPKSAERATGKRVCLLYPYQTASPMWLLMLRGPASWSWWDDVPERTLVIKGKNPDHWQWRKGHVGNPDGSAFDIVRDSISEDGYWLSAWAPDHMPSVEALLRPAPVRTALTRAASGTPDPVVRDPRGSVFAEVAA